VEGPYDCEDFHAGSRAETNVIQPSLQRRGRSPFVAVVKDRLVVGHQGIKLLDGRSAELTVWRVVEGFNHARDPFELRLGIEVGDEDEGEEGGLHDEDNAVEEARLERNGRIKPSQLIMSRDV